MPSSSRNAEAVPKRSRVPAPPLYFNFHDLPGVLADETGYLLAYVAQMTHLRMDEELGPLDIDARQYAVMTLIGETEHRSQVAISQNLGLDRTHVVRLVDDLEALGYVSREKDASDRRYYKLVLTERGEQVLHDAKRCSERAHNDAFRCLDGDERQHLTQLLQKIARQRFSLSHRDVL